MTTSTRRRPGEEGKELSELHERWDVAATPQVWIPRGDDIATYEREQRQRARQDLGRTRRGMGQAGGGGGRSGKRARADQVLYTAVLRSVELCSAVLLTKTLKTPSPPVMNFWVGSNAKNPFPGGIFQQ